MAGQARDSGGFSAWRAIGGLCVCVALIPIGGIQAAQKVPPKTIAGGARCKALGSMIEGAVKEIAYLQASNDADDSAPRGAVRASKIGSLQGEIQNEITLMGATHCAPFGGTLSPQIYQSPARRCAQIEMDERRAAQRAQYLAEETVRQSEQKEMLDLRIELVSKTDREKAERIAELSEKQRLGHAEAVAALAKEQPADPPKSRSECDRAAWLPT